MTVLTGAALVCALFAFAVPLLFGADGQIIAGKGNALTPSADNLWTGGLPGYDGADGVFSGEEDDILELLPRELTQRDYIVTAVTADKTEGRMVKSDTSFKITTANDMAAADLRSLLVLEPGIAFNLSKDAPCEFTLKSRAKLPENSIVKLNLMDTDGATARRWAFQTTGIFRITSTLPADETTSVPTNTGIEIAFSYEVHAADMDDYFTIEPEVAGRFQKFRNTVVFIPDFWLQEATVYTITVKAGLPSVDGAKLTESVSFKFKTNYSYRRYEYLYTNGGLAETFIKGDTAVIELRCSESLRDLTENR